jgi:hypothetical protein
MEKPPFPVVVKHDINISPVLVSRKIPEVLEVGQTPNSNSKFQAF